MFLIIVTVLTNHKWFNIEMEICHTNMFLLITDKRRLLIWRGYIYKYNSSEKNGQIWMCAGNAQCPVYIKVDEKNNLKKVSPFQHNHLPPKLPESVVRKN